MSRADYIEPTDDHQYRAAVAEDRDFDETSLVWQAETKALYNVTTQ